MTQKTLRELLKLMKRSVPLPETLQQKLRKSKQKLASMSINDMVSIIQNINKAFRK